jgi:hypothetical protein
MMKQDKTDDTSNCKCRKSRINGGMPTLHKSMNRQNIKNDNQNEYQVKVTSEDSEENKVKELIYIFANCTWKEALIDLKKIVLKLGNCYSLFTKEK